MASLFRSHDDEFEVELLPPGERSSLTASMNQLLAEIAACEPVAGGWNLRESVWPALDLQRRRDVEVTPKLAVMPLSRLGSPGGLSGATVVVGYFFDQGPGSTLFPSRPMVIKLYRPPASGADKLLEEYDRGEAVKPFVGYDRDAFAHPLRFHPADTTAGHSVLWSPFSSSEWLWEGFHGTHENKPNLAITDFSSLLTEEPSERKGEVLETVFKLLTPFHLRAGLHDRNERLILDEYHDYLRGIYLDEPGRSDWVESWKDIWAPESEPRIRHCGRDWANPLWVLSQLKEVKALLACGAVHGDLHPRNIVLSATGVPHIIDFGWASEHAHIAKDFVLMECNLRFMTLRPDVPTAELEQLAAWLAFDSAAPTALRGGACGYVVSLVETLRRCARHAFAGHAVDWDIEYIVPLFLTAFGLIRYLASARNQESARLTVLSLADLIARQVLRSRAGTV